MALPAFQAAGASASGLGSCVPAWPTHESVDIGLLFAETRGEDVVDTPAGWAPVGDSPQSNGTGATGTRLTCFWLRATSAAELAPTVTGTGFNHVIAQILTFRGCVASGDPWDVTAGDNAAASTSVSIPGDTTTLADCLIVAACSSAFATTLEQFSGWANTDLANVSERADSFTDVQNGGGFGVATGEKAAAGAYGATTATLANSSTQGRISLALKPALDNTIVTFGSRQHPPTLRGPGRERWGGGLR